METAKTTAINSLIEINNDRWQGYKTATDETDETDLKAIFMKLGQQSMGYAQELKQFVTGEDMKSDETTNSGKLFRVWMDIKAALTGKNRKAILSSCEFGEDAAKKTYDEVLEHSSDISPAALEVIRRQRAEIQQGHDTIKSMRDSAK